jgi:hypothetical protein
LLNYNVHFDDVGTKTVLDFAIMGYRGGETDLGQATIVSCLTIGDGPEFDGTPRQAEML